MKTSALSTLRLLTCGSVDDGKSTRIGRLLYEQRLIHDDQLAALERDCAFQGVQDSSRRHGMGLLLRRLNVPAPGRFTIQ
jgi:sulfate adenylyltransferase subunit 1 (EFTu-like GTPase family)